MGNPLRPHTNSNSEKSYSLQRDDRSEGREEIEALATIRSPLKNAERVQIADLSSHGCRLESGAHALRIGQFITIKFAGLEYLRGIVRWVDGDKAGIEFSRPLHPAVFEFQRKANAPQDAKWLEVRP
jgi:hypothetical protein